MAAWPYASDGTVTTAEPAETVTPVTSLRILPPVENLTVIKSVELLSDKVNDDAAVENISLAIEFTIGIKFVAIQEEPL